ncbi:cysteine-rich PDZ-binding protein isoform X2 [Apis laboriosa]|uniref:cysteine-rich PDZ-binding protein isoform X2 n=1 Tax=Apis laboriosa TaxID=183418 RepID=UPI001CC3C8E7|nr:cysteine-rich PDZ-binding protein isoform X2 [Apis laboriosa]
MVCEKCEKKLGKVITPDPWKNGARNTVESGGRKVGENKALSAGKTVNIDVMRCNSENRPGMRPGEYRRLYFLVVSTGQRLARSDHSHC